MADVADSSMALRTVTRQLADDAWPRPVRILGSAPFPAAQLLIRRLVEVELHHCDLAAGYTPADSAGHVTSLDLAEPMRSQREDRLSRPRELLDSVPRPPPGCQVSQEGHSASVVMTADAVGLPDSGHRRP